MANKQKTAEKRKNQILEAALQCFMEKGFYTTTMDDIVKKSKLSKGALYWYFESKDQLLEAVMEYWFLQATENLKNSLSEVTDIKKSLKILGDEMFSEITDHQLLRGMFFEYLSHAARNPELREVIAGYYRDWMNFFEELLENAVKERQLKIKKIRSVVEHISSVVEGSLLIWVIAPDAINPKKVWEIEMNLIINSY